MQATINGLRIAIVALSGYWLVLFICTHLPPSALPPLRVNDKLIHACAFAGLAFLIAWAVPTKKTHLHYNTVIAALIAIVYAAFDELLQIPVGRTADWLDFSADCFGILIGIIFYTLARAALLKGVLKVFDEPVQRP